MKKDKDHDVFNQEAALKAHSKQACGIRRFRLSSTSLEFRLGNFHQ
jgi:hypothetical protein